MKTENLSTLKIHKLTQAQYERELEAGRIDASALYLTPDEEIDIEVDTTLSQSGKAADAKAVGDAFAQATSDAGMMLLQNETGVEYSEAIDVEGAPYTYTETEKSIETGEIEAC